MKANLMKEELPSRLNGNRIALISEWLLDGTGEQPLERAALIISKGRIEDVLPAEKMGAHPEFPCLQLHDTTILPGLIDSHVHLTFNPHSEDLVAYHVERSDELLLLQAAENARKALMSGVTTVCDLGARNDIGFTLQEAIEKGIVEGPHLVVAGRPITCFRGHLHYMGGEVLTPDQIERLIMSQIDRGARVTKIIATGGGLTPGSGLMKAHFSRQDLDLMVKVSHRRNTPIAAHASWGPVIQQCAELGFDRIEHCTFITSRGLIIDQDVLSMIKKHNPYVVPTRYQFALKRNRPVLTDGLAKEIKRSFKEMYEDSMVQLSRFRQEGMKIAAGSDAGITDVLFDGVIGELETMVMAGYSPLEAVRAGTRNSADALNVLGDRGVIKKGLRADLLAVRGPVHIDISSLRNISLVLKDGRIVLDNGLTARCA